MEDNLQEQIDGIKQQLQQFNYSYDRMVRSDRIVPNRNVFLLDGGTISAGSNLGTKIGEGATDKLGFYGVTPVDQPASVGDVSSVGATYSQSEVNAIVTKVNTILDRLQELGLIA
jgi:hypothetical protein